MRLLNAVMNAPIATKQKRNVLIIMFRKEPVAIMILILVWSGQDGQIFRAAELTPGQAITNVQAIGFRDRKFPEDVLGPVVMKILNGLITKIALLKAKSAVIANA